MYKNNNSLKSLPCALAALFALQTASAFELVNTEDNTLAANLEIASGIFYSNKNYLYDTDRNGAKWQEGYIKFGLSGEHTLGQNTALYGTLSGLSSATFGDGDAGGFTTGDERDTVVEDAFIGFKMTSQLPIVGQRDIDISFGRQNFAIGDGFLINGDALNVGKGLNGDGLDFDRGGAYWLAAKRAFSNTFVAKMGGELGFGSDVFWLKSNNKAQAETEVTGLNVEYITTQGTFGLMHMEGLDVNKPYAQALGLTHRDGQKTTSLRYQGSAGIDPLFLSAEFVHQNQGDASRKNAKAWYLEAGWTYEKFAWSPSVNVRYSVFGEDFDPLFFGFNRSYGTWFQGEVAANYAGPFNSDTHVFHVNLKANPLANLSLGAMFFDFSDTARGSGTLDSQEIDLYAEWAVNDKVFISPVVGFYKPKKTASAGGSQLQDKKLNTYWQLVTVLSF